MALLKEKESESGVTLRYHRIASIDKITNNVNRIEVASYPSEKMRAVELAAIEAGEKIAHGIPREEAEELMSLVVHNVYIETSLYDADYDPAMLIQDAYEWLKSKPEYEGAEDVLEGEEAPE